MEYESQLQMIHRAPATVSRESVPGDFTVRTFQSGDEAAWTRIVNTTIDGDRTVDEARDELFHQPRFDPEGLFFAVRDEEVVGTACAWRDDPPAPEFGVLHMVGVLPNHRGHGLGAVLCRQVLQYFADANVPFVRLDTDDWRHPAIATYLQLGFEPLCRDASHESRWASVYEEIGREPPEEWLQETALEAFSN
jgi:mycothiol synthase